MRTSDTVPLFGIVAVVESNVPGSHTQTPNDIDRQFDSMYDDGQPSHVAWKGHMP